jgi:hypothetical protein
VAVELTRGDLPTPTSAVAANIASIEGAGTAAQLLAKLGTSTLVRGWDYTDNREAVLSHLIRVSYPAAGETGQDLRAAADAQHRGRLFLPFADDDPKTAEVVSKALMLARDHEIKDPTILEQLRS